jgi:hypothetical protein
VEALLASIVPAYKVTPDGGISTSELSIRLYEGALIQLLDVDPSGLTATEFERCAWKALTETIKAQTASCSVFEKKLDKQIEEFKREKPSRFRACSRCHFSVPHDYRLDIKLWGATLTITQGPPKGLSTEQPTLPDGRTAFAAPEFGAYLTMTVHERTKGGALDRATHRIAFLLGLLNFTLNLGSLSWSLFHSEPKFHAKLFPGREVFLLDEDGVADVESWRYYTVLPNRVETLNAKELKRLEEHTKIIDRLRKLKKGDQAFYQTFFELYFDALSELDADSVVIRLWKAAEHITQGQDAQHIANRLALTWSDAKAVSAVCYALGQRRNLIMHNSKPAPQIGELPQLFRHFLEEAAWKSLSKDVKSVAHWKTIMQMSGMDIDIDLASDALQILKKLR